jgi:hypothetical protein
VALSCALAGTSETATAATTTDAVITGTVTFHEATPDRSIEVFRDVDGAWTEDPSRSAAGRRRSAWKDPTP